MDGAGGMRARPPRRGLTYLEVVVALALLGLSVGGLGAIAAGQLRLMQVLEGRAAALVPQGEVLDLGQVPYDRPYDPAVDPPRRPGGELVVVVGPRAPEPWEPESPILQHKRQLLRRADVWARQLGAGGWPEAVALPRPAAAPPLGCRTWLPFPGGDHAPAKSVQISRYPDAGNPNVQVSVD